MTPEEFTRQLRTRVERDLPPFVDAIRKITTTSLTTSNEFRRLLEDPGATLAKRGLLRPIDADRATDLALAIFRSRTINQYMDSVAKSYRSDSTLEGDLKSIAAGAAPASVVRRVLQRFLEDDRLVTAPVKLLLEDDGVRKALNLPEEITFETYILKVKRALAKASTLEDISDASRLAGTAIRGEPEPQVFCDVPVCAGIAAVVTVAALVHAVAVAQTYAAAWAVVKTFAVFTVGGHELSIQLNSSPVQPAIECESAVVNSSRITLWLTVPYITGHKRIPLHPGCDSRQLGLLAVSAIIIGGRNNLVRVAVEDNTIVSHGAYVLHRSPSEPGIVTIVQTDDGNLQVEPNLHQARAVATNEAGYSDLRGNGSAGPNFNPRFSMVGCAAAYPVGFDWQAAEAVSASAGRFYRSLRLASIFSRLGIELRQD